MKDFLEFIQLLASSQIVKLMPPGRLAVKALFQRITRVGKCLLSIVLLNQAGCLRRAVFKTIRSKAFELVS